jgi:hypothetical protein
MVLDVPNVQAFDLLTRGAEVRTSAPPATAAPAPQHLLHDQHLQHRRRDRSHRVA